MAIGRLEAMLGARMEARRGAGAQAQAEGARGAAARAHGSRRARRARAPPVRAAADGGAVDAAFARDLYMGCVGADVRLLQTYLVDAGYLHDAGVTRCVPCGEKTHPRRSRRHSRAHPRP